MIEQTLEEDIIKTLKSHFNGYTQEEAIAICKQKRGDRYDYSKSIYLGSQKIMDIICKLHGLFQQSFASHISGANCPKCYCEEMSKKFRSNVTKLIEESNKIHNFKYDYSYIGDYKNQRTKMKIWCKNCKKFFWQNFYSHLQGDGCPYCIGRHRTTKEFIDKATTKHINEDGYCPYSYHETLYLFAKKKVKIWCKMCQRFFWQTPAKHLKGRGCNRCKTSLISNTKDFIKKSQYLHKDIQGNFLFDYTEVNYVKAHIKVKILCLKCGEYFLQTPNNHLNGQGCPHCKESKGAKFIIKFLRKHKLKFEIEKRYKDCRDNKPLPFDFYLNDMNGLIEFDGKQHFEAYVNWGGEDQLKYIKYHDSIKNKYCIDNNIPLLRIPYWLLKTPKIIEEMILDFIKEHTPS